jgi:hypothetical protein
VICLEIASDPQTVEIVIVGPMSRWRAVLSGRDPVPPWGWRKNHQHRKEAVKQ